MRLRSNVALGDAVEGERQRAVGGALDGRVPVERDRILPVLGVVAAAERVGAAFEREPREPRRNRPPGVVAHRAVNPPHHFAAADVDVADVARLDDQRQRAGADAPGARAAARRRRGRGGLRGAASKVAWVTAL